MKFGITQVGEDIFCENCKKIISTNGEYSQNYCSNCGAPLKSASVEEYLNRQTLIKNSFIEELDKVYQQNKDCSFKQIMCKFLEK